MLQFQNSEIYKKALQEYQEKVFGHITKPLHSVVIDLDEVYLFYSKEIINDVFATMTKIYNGEVDGFTTHLGHENPRIETIKFMGTEYRVIVLWYDNCDVPYCFSAKI